MEATLYILQQIKGAMLVVLTSFRRNGRTGDVTTGCKSGRGSTAPVYQTLYAIGQI